MLKKIIQVFSKYFPVSLMANRGFTLIELLVAIGIFTLLSSFMVVNYRDNETIRTLKNQAQETIAGMEKIQNMALTGESVNGASPASYQFSIAECAANCSYKLSAVFADHTDVISQTNLKSVSIKGSLQADFSPPRGNMTISPGNLSTAAFEIYNAQAAYCVKVNSVSGRIDLVSGSCP